MRKTRHAAERTREAILDAAEAVFFQQGVAQASLEEIARLAGVTRGAVYWHFDNKLAIFTAISDRASQPHQVAFAALAEAPGHPLDQLEACLATTFADYGRDHDMLVRLTVVLLRCDYVGDMAPALAGSMATVRILSSRIERYFAEQMVPGASPADWDAAHLGRLLYTSMHGMIMLWLRSPDEFPLHTTGVNGVRTLCDMIRQRWHPHAPPGTLP